MQRFWIVTLLLLMLGTVSSASAVTFDMYESYTNRDGVITPGAAGIFTPDLTWSTTFSSAGDHYFGFYIDAEIDEPLNTFFNESGAAHGIPAAGQSWEIDEPGFLFGNIFNNFETNSLDNFNNVPENFADDVSMALAWDFTLFAGETAFLNFILSDIEPTSGFYLEHNDPDSNTSLFFSSTLRVQPSAVIPEPSTVVLFGSVIAGLGFYLRKRRKI